jgi:glycosyltransferase involved in cell wall biosynthesis
MIRIAILNAHLCTFGGGEKATYALASTLAAAGHAVDVVTTEPAPPEPARIAAFFGPGHDGFGIRAVPEEELERALASYAVLVNHSSGSRLPNPCPLGIYFVMFPDAPPGPWARSYQHFVCNSLYTERHTRRRWGAALATRVIYPPADADLAPAAKRQEILAVGRFSAQGHRKNQAFLVDAFVRSAERLPAGWSLTLIGKVRADRPSVLEVLHLIGFAAKAPVRFLLDASDAEKRAALARASIYWHGTGALASREAPEQQEHFGIAVVEAMRAAAVPICFDGGGPREIVEHGETGYLFQDAEGLLRATDRLARDPALLARMAARARARAERFSRARFDAEVTRLFGAVIAA